MITNLKSISEKLHLKIKTLAIDEKSFTDFPLRVPESFVARMKSNDPQDPLLLQVLPSNREFEHAPGFSLDPLREKSASPIPGLIHKYHDRVLLLVTNHCAINCRFCFRRHSQEVVTDWQKVFAYIKNESNITEVILSGGDPLMLAADKLAGIIDSLALVSHLKRVRIHSRVPIVMPERITTKLLPTKFKLPLVLVVHCNHPHEIDQRVAKALGLIRKQGIPIFNQSVLLRSINDDSSTLIALSEKLFNAGVIPYYLHLLDKVKGAVHFHVNISKAKRIYAAMQKKLPGYLVPKLMMEDKNGKRNI